MQDPSRGAFTADFAWPAPAKLNLFLHITGRRADGYHELQTLYQFLDFGDRLYFVPRGDGEIHRLAGTAAVAPEQDLVVRAARALQRACGCGLGADIRVDKRIPLGAGLGGGSSDAATTLVALNRLWNLGFTADELADLGLGLGADVPVFVRGQAAWAEGIGERLTPVDLVEPWFVVVVAPAHVRTADIYADPELERDCARIGLAEFLAGQTRNVFEPVTTRRHPQVGEALTWLRRFGPARMSGTGASVFLACESAEQAQAIAARVPRGWASFVARGRNRSPLRDAMDR
ncbi:4-(cytidine 5'-diphospho)-2-C-methyl-D-erythritol kinase [Fontimonas sp. SYSU GA230001]|uniref:4-(cytidine 5'-diphospho)-2-C-methyl-D-erythritol kinase n=1 Tax=Fontimonas sp. SYSU GA230001 TaxID=3142450 RepID=UPI0032B62782